MECHVCQKAINGPYVEYETENFAFGGHVMVLVVAHPGCYAEVRKLEYTPPGICWHSWQEYIGFRERYWFCTHCQDKIYSTSRP